MRISSALRQLLDGTTAQIELVQARMCKILRTKEQNIVFDLDVFRKRSLEIFAVNPRLLRFHIEDFEPHGIGFVAWCRHREVRNPAIRQEFRRRIASVGRRNSVYMAERQPIEIA